MSQIVTINEVKITNLDLAKEVLGNLGWNESKSKTVKGMGSLNKADFVYDISARYNLGLRANAEGSYDIVFDQDARRDVVEKFVVSYTKEFVETEIKLQGKTFQTTENENEITIEYDA